MDTLIKEWSFLRASSESSLLGLQKVLSFHSPELSTAGIQAFHAGPYLAPFYAPHIFRSKVPFLDDGIVTCADDLAPPFSSHYLLGRCPRPF
uniref:Uncharacterized protein n=1 Tax=Steinernema glaseri TaxID=37863 RepID=A0A1I7YYG6_9BILA